jgi:lactoylglutathione lyase
MKFEFNHFNFNVADLDRSLKFYDDALGLKEVRRSVAKDGRYIIVFLTDEATDFKLELTWLNDHPNPYDLGEQEFHLAMLVDDYETAYEHHKKMGVIIYENKEMDLYFLEDPDGYWIEILSKNRRK